MAANPKFPAVPVPRLWDAGGRGEGVDSRFGKGRWRVSDLLEVVKDEPVFNVPLWCLDLGAHDFGTRGGLVGFASHMKHVMECDKTVPITLDEWGGVVDGRHRIVKALIDGDTTIPAKRVPPGSTPTSVPD